MPQTQNKKKCLKFNCFVILYHHSMQTCMYYTDTVLSQFRLRNMQINNLFEYVIQTFIRKYLKRPK